MAVRIVGNPETGQGSFTVVVSPVVAGFIFLGGTTASRDVGGAINSSAYGGTLIISLRRTSAVTVFLTVYYVVSARSRTPAPDDYIE